MVLRVKLLRPPFRRHLTTSSGASRTNGSCCFGRHFDGISQPDYLQSTRALGLLRPPFRRHLTTAGRKGEGGYIVASAAISTASHNFVKEVSVTVPVASAAISTASHNVVTGHDCVNCVASAAISTASHNSSAATSSPWMCCFGRHFDGISQPS